MPKRPLEYGSTFLPLIETNMFTEDRKQVLKRVWDHISQQLSSPQAVDELRSLGPKGFDWNDRVQQAVAFFLPRLVDIAPTIATECVMPFNSPFRFADHLQSEILRQAISRLRDIDPVLSAQLSEWLEESRVLAAAGTLPVSNVESQQISAEVKRYLLSDRGFGNTLKANGGSLYPDLLLASADYRFLSFQSRDTPIDGPCLNNVNNPRPSNVPDGLEVKTNQASKVRVDAHGIHPGLHLAVTWGFATGKVVMRDVCEFSGK